ncbi:ubiquitin carboxyl-terminal hydrolase [Rhynchospora pubera]|uniref:Ubiquitin carboxyl-terminal hydrolase n=1 Tax=Rhynchospora pubera TaxID=906938 RepID=A0AAV8HTK3_9POAL|nr:ubiquitin carboxyl-terminal hydrolase [Rhynchospora pubera]
MLSLSRLVPLLLLLLVFLICSPTIAKGSNLVPQPAYRSILIEESRARRLTGSFHICALCTCCGGPRGLCLPSPCCYAINCNIPNRPFGYCSFTPRTCNCFGCRL